MSNIIQGLLPPPPIINSYSANPEWYSIFFNGASTSGAWPAANRAIYCPFEINQTILITKLFTVNGATASNSLDIGIYDFSGTRIVSTGSTLQSGTNALQVIDITDTIIGSGRYYIGLAMNGTTGTFFRYAFGDATFPSRAGVFTQTSAFALPATATYATPATGYIPLMGLATVVTV